MNITKLEALKTIVLCGSFSKAAMTLGYTQSGLTHMMNSLEEEIGFPLLCRGYYGVRLSENGEKLMPQINALLTAYDTLDKSVEDLKTTSQEVIRIGAYSSMAMHFLPGILQRFKQDFPNVRIEITQQGYHPIFDDIEADRIDIAFGSNNKKKNVEFIHLVNDQFMAILPAEYRKANQKEFPVDNFNGSHFLMPSRGFDVDIMSVLTPMDVHPDIQATSVEDSTIISMVEHGLGMSMLTELVIKGHNDDVCAIPIRPNAYRDLGIILNAQKQITPSLKCLIDHSKEFVKDEYAEYI